MINKISIALSLLIDGLRAHIMEMHIDFDNDRLKIILNNNITLFIRYNNHGQYAYTIQFSFVKFDRIRYDNYDDRWDIKTKPHHCHPRYQLEAIESQFIGDPTIDIPAFITVCKSFLQF